MSKRIIARSKQQDFTWGLILAAVFIVIIYDTMNRVPWWALLIAVFGSVTFDRIIRSSPKKGVYIE